MIAGRGRNKRTAALTAAFLAAAAPAPARAHLVTSGLGPVYDGISHLLLSPDDLLAALAMSMVGGLNGTPAARRTLFVLSAAWLMGGMAGLVVRSPLPAISTTMSLLALGGLAATDLRLPAVAVAALAGGVGMLHGYHNGVGMASAGSGAAGLAGIVAAVFALTAIASAGVLSAQPGWRRIAIRVVGSWVAAIGLLMLGWTLRSG